VPRHCAQSGAPLSGAPIPPCPNVELKAARCELIDEIRVRILWLTKLTAFRAPRVGVRIFRVGLGAGRRVGRGREKTKRVGALRNPTHTDGVCIGSRRVRHEHQRPQHLFAWRAGLRGGLVGWTRGGRGKAPMLAVWLDRGTIRAGGRGRATQRALGRFRIGRIAGGLGFRGKRGVDLGGGWGWFAGGPFKRRSHGIGRGLRTGLRVVVGPRKPVILGKGCRRPPRGGCAVSAPVEDSVFWGQFLYSMAKRADLRRKIFGGTGRPGAVWKRRRHGAPVGRRFRQDCMMREPASGQVGRAR